MDSQKPTTYIAQATALANEKINPIEPPNSGPSDLEIMKYVPPPVDGKQLLPRANYDVESATFDDSIGADGAHGQSRDGGDDRCGRN